MNGCPKISNLRDFLGNSLTLDRQDELAQHVDSCENCQTMLDDLSQTDVDLLNPSNRESDSAVPEEYVDRMSRWLCGEMAKPTFANAKQRQKTLPRRTVIGDYELDGVIGIGGMGTVYRARHTKLDRLVAVKVFEEEQTFDPGDESGRLARFRRELRAIGRLNHPNIVNAFDAGEFGKYHYLAMEYVEGANLQQLIRQFGKMSVADACEIVRQAAIGLQHSFEAGLVHRDIKPSNVMLSVSSDSASAKILDLGLARFHELSDSREEALSRDGLVLGTLDYMAPEQFSGSQVDIRADIYGLGATLFFLLTAQSHLPESSDNLLEKIRVRAIKPNRSLAEVDPEFPLKLVEIVDRMLQKDPRRRQKNPAEVSALLQPFCKGNALLKYAPKRLVEADCDTDKFALPSRLSDSNGRLNQENGVKTNPVAAGFAEPGGNSLYGIIRWVSIGLAFAFVVLSVIIIRLRTDGGEIVIRCHDPNLEIEIVQNDKDVKSFEAGQLKDYSWFRSGKYEVRIPQLDDDELVIRNGEFSLKRGEKHVVSIEVNRSASTKPKPASDAKGKYVVWEFPDGGRYVKNKDGAWTVHFAKGGVRDIAVIQISNGDKLPLTVNDPYHGLWFRFDETTVEVSQDKGETWSPFYSGKGKWIYNEASRK